MSDFDNTYPHTRSGFRQPHWPDDVQGISMEGLNLIGLDTEGRLYWDGKLLRVASPLELTTLQGVFAVIGVISAVSLAIFDALRFFGYSAGPQ